MPRVPLVAIMLPLSPTRARQSLLELDLFKSDTFEILHDSHPSANAFMFLTSNDSAFPFKMVLGMNEVT
jgi:hypothetical protein